MAFKEMVLLGERTSLYIFIPKFFLRCHHVTLRMGKKGGACEAPWLLGISLNLLEMKGSESTDGADSSFERTERASLLANCDLCGQKDS